MPMSMVIEKKSRNSWTKISQKKDIERLWQFIFFVQWATFKLFDFIVNLHISK